MKNDKNISSFATKCLIATISIAILYGVIVKLDVGKALSEILNFVFQAIQVAPGTTVSLIIGLYACKRLFDKFENADTKKSIVDAIKTLVLENKAEDKSKDKTENSDTSQPPK